MRRINVPKIVRFKLLRLLVSLLVEIWLFLSGVGCTSELDRSAGLHAILALFNGLGDVDDLLGTHLLVHKPW